VVFFLLGALHFYSLSFVATYIRSGVGPLLLSLQFTTLSFVIGFVFAIPLAIARAFPPGRSAILDPMRLGVRGPLQTRLRRAVLWPFYGFASGYVAVVRGTPFLVQVFVVYYAFIFSLHRLIFLGEPLEFWAGLLALSINSTGYQAEALRGGLQSVEAGQVDAARALGMTGGQIFRRVILPQSIRLVTLPLTNEWISNFKTSTILSYITIYELFSWSRTYIALTLSHPIEALVMLAIFYLAINVTLSRTVTWVEKTVRIPGLGSLPVERIARPSA
jgi:His/Glu/Gln/Arg/opine family amino acid ABC transporter permease subunit